MHEEGAKANNNVFRMQFAPTTKLSCFTGIRRFSMKTSLAKAAPLVGALGVMFAVPSSYAAGTIEIDETRWVSFGAGIRAGFTSRQDGAPSGDDSNEFNVQSLRLYVNGQAHEKVKFTFNTECESCVFGQDPNDPIG